MAPVGVLHGQALAGAECQTMVPSAGVAAACPVHAAWPMQLPGSPALCWLGVDGCSRAGVAMHAGATCSRHAVLSGGAEAMHRLGPCGTAPMYSACAGASEGDRQRRVGSRAHRAGALRLGSRARGTLLLHMQLPRAVHH